MSFSKAKLQRFNDVLKPTPSPADYNVNTKDRISGASIPKGERFADLRSPSRSDNSSFLSNSLTSVFKTPTVPRKTKHQASSSDRKLRVTPLFKNDDELEALKEKIVECNNKDLFIQDLTEQVEELKLELNDLQTQIGKLNHDKAGLIVNIDSLKEEHEQSKTNLNLEYQTSLKSLCEKVAFIANLMEEIKKEYSLLQKQNLTDLAQILKDISKLEELTNVLNKSCKMALDNAMEDIANKDRQLAEFQETMDNLKKSYEESIIILQENHQLEINNIEIKTQCSIKEIRNMLEEKENVAQQLEKTKDAEIMNLKVQFKKDKEIIEGDMEARIKQLTENYEEAKVLAEIQMKEKCNDIEMNWKLKLAGAKEESEAILKECQAIAEYNVIESEVSKNKALFEVAKQKKDIDTLQTRNVELKNNYNQLKDKFALLQTELNSAGIEVKKVREKIIKDEENYKYETENLKREKSIYEKTIVKTHKTIETLKNRLMRSDKDVEQLKAELETIEGSKLEIEARCNQLMDELQIVCGLCDDMDEQNQVALRISEEKVNQVEQELINKVEEFKQKASEEMNLKNEELKKTKLELTDTLVLLHNQQQLIDDAQIVISRSNDMIENIEQTNYELITKHSELEVAFENLKSELTLYQDKEITWNKTKEYLIKENEQLHIAIESKQKDNEDLLAQICNLKESQPKENNAEDFVVICKKYQELNEKYNFIAKQLKEAEDHNKVLIKQVEKQESLIGPFREHLEAYEMEYGALFSQKEDAEKEAKEMGMKYAQIMGHQNQKQKIKHLMDLKKKNDELKENKKDLENKVRTQTRTIDKLKKELSSVTNKYPKSFLQTPNKDKENVESPNHSVNGNRLDSPGGPLKERN